MKNLCHKMALSLDHFCHQEIGTRSQAKRNKAANHKTTMHCLYFLMWSIHFNADNVGYTARHLYQCIVEHKNLAIRKLLAEAHGQLHNPIEDQSAKVSNKVWMPNSWNAVYKRDEAKLEHPGRSNSCKTIHLSYRSWHFILGF